MFWALCVGSPLAVQPIKELNLWFLFSSPLSLLSLSFLFHLSLLSLLFNGWPCFLYRLWITNRWWFHYSFWWCSIPPEMVSTLSFNTLLAYTTFIALSAQSALNLWIVMATCCYWRMDDLYVKTALIHVLCVRTLSTMRLSWLVKSKKGEGRTRKGGYADHTNTTLLSWLCLGEEVYHADCFRCTSCRDKIVDLVFTQTSKVRQRKAGDVRHLHLFLLGYLLYTVLW